MSTVSGPRYILTSVIGVNTTTPNAVITNHWTYAKKRYRITLIGNFFTFNATGLKPPGNYVAPNCPVQFIWGGGELSLTCIFNNLYLPNQSIAYVNATIEEEEGI